MKRKPEYITDIIAARMIGKRKCETCSSVIDEHFIGKCPVCHNHTKPYSPFIKISFLFAWYDLWVGAYWDRKNKWLYVMIPTVGIILKFRK